MAKANVQILGVGHATFLGARGEAGGAPSKDSIFGVAIIYNSLVTFGGRRGGTLRFKTYKKNELDAQVARFQKKLSGKPFGAKIDAHYTQVTDEAMALLLGADFADKLAKNYHGATFAKKLNTYTRIPKAKRLEMAAAAAAQKAAKLAAKAEKIAA
jgi:hypothetical protein